MAPTKIREALELLRERGWCQGDYRDDAGRLCIEGALARAWDVPFSTIGIWDVGKEDFKTVCRVAKEQHGICPASVFNDSGYTTFADVELVMEKAAVMREEAVE